MAARNKMALVLFVAIQAAVVVCRRSTDGESNSNDATSHEMQGKAVQGGQRHITQKWQYDGIPIEIGVRGSRVPRPNERAPAAERIRAQSEISRVRAQAENAKIRAREEKSRLREQAEKAKSRAQAEKSRVQDMAKYAKVRAQPEMSKARFFGDVRRHMTPLWQYDGAANELSRRRAHRPAPEHDSPPPPTTEARRSHRRHKSHTAPTPESSDEAWSPSPTAPATSTTTTPTTTTTTTPEPVFPPLDPRYRRIYNADETAKIEDYPFIAAILVNNELWCGGAIVRGDAVLTAAHCLQLQYNNRFFREYVKMLSVRVGSSNATDGGEHYRVTELFFHPNYKPQSLEFNFALVKLNKNITFKDSKVQPITVARNKVVPIDKTVTFLGWGSVLGVGEGGGQVLLQKLDLPIYDLFDCQEIYGRDLVTRSNFCAGYISTRKNVCNHDAGGPAIMDGVLTGVLSFSSKRCDDTDKPAVFSNTGHAADWLDGIWEGHSRVQKNSVSGWLNALESKKYIN